MDATTRAKVNVTASIIKHIIDVIVTCEDNLELDVLDYMIHKNITYLCDIIHEENRGVKYESDK